MAYLVKICIPGSATLHMGNPVGGGGGRSWRGRGAEIGSRMQVLPRVPVAAASLGQPQIRSSVCHGNRQDAGASHMWSQLTFLKYEVLCLVFCGTREICPAARQSCTEVCAERSMQNPGAILSLCFSVPGMPCFLFEQYCVEVCISPLFWICIGYMNLC